MLSKNFRVPFIIIINAALFISCQKEIDGFVVTGGGIVPVSMKPKVGTIWTYRYYTYNINGSLSTSDIVIYKAQSEETFGGENWLKVVDVNKDTVVGFLKEKTGGLFQYVNNNSNLLCKYPASVNDTYSTFNEGTTENFTVKGVNDTLQTGIGNVPANYYEGVKGTQLIDLIWYNTNSWIVRKSQYRSRSVLVPFYYKYYTFFLDNIVY